MDLATGTRLGSYEILSPLGAGGMGQVYLAQDTRLRRKVALKILPADLTGNADRLRRFEHEAQAASALNHPNIITIYDIGQAGASHFIAAEYVEGDTLRQHLRRFRAPISEVLDIAVQIADALSEAHRAGIIHRDIKPENLILKKNGLVKLLDFGLAKLTERHAPSNDTSAPTVAQVDTGPNVILGTLAYMSPEQARGRRVDARTDVFSFGALLYEMVTGRAPYEGETTSDLIAAILMKEAEPLSHYSPEAPAELQRIISKALRKDREERYQTMKDMLVDLKALKQELEFMAKLERSVSPDSSGRGVVTSGGVAATTATEQGVTTHPADPTISSAEYIVSGIRRHRKAAILALLALLLGGVGLYFLLRPTLQPKETSSLQASGISSVAVLPFVNASGNADIEYLSDGMTESLINSLSQLPNLSVKARSTVFRYKGKETDPQQVGSELNVQAVLNGRVLQRGEQLTVGLELVDARTGNQIWGEQYNRKQTDLVALQGEIARDVSNKLQVKLSGADKQRLAKTYTANTEAYRLYLLGRFHWNKRTVSDFRKAIEYFQQAIAADPNYALAYAGLAESQMLSSEYGDEPLREAIPKARENALKALSLDEQLAEAHTALGLVLCDDYDFAGAEREYKRALALNPNEAMAHNAYGHLLSYFGRPEEGLAEVRRALEIEPFSLAFNRSCGDVLFRAHRYDESIAQFKKTLTLDANWAPVYSSLSATCWMKGDYAESVETFAKYREVQGRQQAAALARESFSKGGWKGFLQMRIAGLLSPTINSDQGYTLAIYYAALGEKDEALAALNKAYENHEFGMILLKADPRLDPLRDDPRFQDLLRRVGLPK